MASTYEFTVTIGGDFTREQAREALRDSLFGEELFARMESVPDSAAEYVGMMLDRHTGDLCATIDILPG